MKKALISLLISLFCLASGFQAFAVEAGETAPDFRLPSLEGKKVSLSDYKGQPVILKLATTWCPTCKQQSEEIARIGDFLQEYNVAVVEVFVQERKKVVRDYFEGTTLGKNHVVLVDDGKVAKTYNIYVVPRVLLLDADLKVRRDGSLISGTELKEQIKKFTAK